MHWQICGHSYLHRGHRIALSRATYNCHCRWWSNCYNTQRSSRVKTSTTLLMHGYTARTTRTLTITSKVVVSTWQMFRMTRFEARDTFTAILVDEGDYGTVQTARSSVTEHAWWRVLEHYSSSARVLLLSATQHRSDKVPLPEPFYTYTYDDALRDGVVKQVQFIILQPRGACVVWPQ